MIRLIKILILLAIFQSCKPIKVEPVGFYNANYVTKTNENQEFEYFFDDGELVAGGLDEYVAKIETEAGTFSEEKILLLKYKSKIEQLNDTIIPFTYFMGLKFEGDIQKDVTFSLNANYLYNNPAHLDYAEYLFLKNNLSQLKLFEVEYEDMASIYYDPDVTVTEVPFEIKGKDIQFKTKSKTALYGLCWVEKNWEDTLQFQTGSLNQMNIYQGNKAKNNNLEGAYFNQENQQFYMNYTDLSLQDSLNSIHTGWHFYQMNLIIDQPQLGMMDNANVYLDAVIFQYDPGFEPLKSYLRVVNTTNVEFINWPNANEYGQLHIYGNMLQESNQQLKNVDFLINFKRQR